LSKRLFDLLHVSLGINPLYRHELAIAAKLLSIGVGIRYYAYQRHSHYLTMSALDYALSHPQIVLISHLLLFKKGSTSSSLIPKGSYGALLPENGTLDALSTLLWLSHILLASRINASDLMADLDDNGALVITGKNLYLTREQLKNIILPKNLTLILKES
jgi:exopolyphosphatase/pppGpp-phosphohydrolase